MTDHDVGRSRPARVRRIALILAIAIAGVVLAILIRAQDSTVLFPNMVSYRPIDQHTIALTVGVAPYSWTRVANVAETSTQVRITIKTLPLPIPAPGTAALELRQLTVSLADDLGDRQVTDANGQPIPAR